MCRTRAEWRERTCGSALAFGENLKEETTRRGKVKRVEPPCVSALAPVDPRVTAEESER